MTLSGREGSPEDDSILSEEEAAERSAQLTKRRDEKGLTIINETNLKYTVAEFQPQSMQYHKMAPVTQEERRAAREKMTPRFEYREEPAPTTSEPAKPKKQTGTRAAKPRASKNK